MTPKRKPMDRERPTDKDRLDWLGRMKLDVCYHFDGWFVVNFPNLPPAISPFAPQSTPP